MTKIKICGLKRMADIEAVNRYLPDYAGFVFAAGKRQVTVREAAHYSRALDERICPVGVYVDAEITEIADAVSQQIIRAVQLHGHESPEYVSRLKEQIPADIPVIKAIGMAVGKEREVMRWDQGETQYLLLDAMAAGGGLPFDHDLIERNDAISKPWFLAGGINAENAASLIHRFSPYGIDVSSGVESDGVKDPVKIEAMIRSVRNE